MALAWYALSAAPEWCVELAPVDGGAMTYTGTMSGGKFAKHGKLVFENGDLYVGGFKDGRFDGDGFFLSAEGCQPDY